MFANSTGWWSYASGGLGVIAGTVAAVSTFLDPTKKANSFRFDGADYQEIRNKARFLYEVKLISDCTDNSLIEELERPNIKHLLQSLFKKRSSATIETAHSVIHGIFDEAINDKWVKGNPAKGLLKKILSAKRQRDVTVFAFKTF